MTFPCGGDRALAATVVKLAAQLGAAILPAERDHARKRLLVLITVKPEIGLAKTSRLLDRGRLSDEKSCAGKRKVTEVHRVPVCGAAVLRGVLTHRRYDDAIDQLQVPHFEI